MLSNIVINCVKREIIQHIEWNFWMNFALVWYTMLLLDARVKKASTKRVIMSQFTRFLLIFVSELTRSVLADFDSGTLYVPARHPVLITMISGMRRWVEMQHHFKYMRWTQVFPRIPKTIVSNYDWIILKESVGRRRNCSLLAVTPTSHKSHLNKICLLFSHCWKEKEKRK